MTFGEHVMLLKDFFKEIVAFICETYISSITQALGILPTKDLTVHLLMPIIALRFGKSKRESRHHT